MNKTVGIVLVILILLGGYYYFSKNKLDQLNVVKEISNETAIGSNLGEQKVSVTDNSKVESTGSYEKYSPEKIKLASEVHDVVLFFRASWCPSCRIVDTDIRANLSKIPPSLTILDVNYDESSMLKQKYGVTYQHTFVQVDNGGNLIKKWSGSNSLASLISEVK